MSLGLFSLFRGPWPNLEPPHHSHHCKVTQTRRGAQCYLVSTTPRPFLREKKGGILMKTLGFSGGWQQRGAVTVFIEQACFRLPSLQVTAQCSLIGSDCQTVFHLIAKKTPAIKRWPPHSHKIPFFPVLRVAAHAAKLFPQARTTNLTLTYENGLLSTFTSSLVLLVGHLLRSTHSCFAWAGRCL